LNYVDLPRLLGLDLFSGIGGLTLALEPWVRPVAYCEVDRHAQAVLLSRQASGHLPVAPIWDDVTTLVGAQVGEPVDIIYGGFPCQDISVAGLGAGLAGKRSGLVFEVLRLISETRPAWVFLENVPAIRARGGERLGQELAALGYDCRWDCLSAYDVGAPHKRERWWLLAHGQARPGDDGAARALADTEIERRSEGGPEPEIHGRRDDAPGSSPPVADPDFQSLEVGVAWDAGQCPSPFGGGWWESEPGVGRVVNGLPLRVDRVRGLGNAVVPACARVAFKRLMGL